MRSALILSGALTAACLGASGCATYSIAPPNVPAQLQPAADQVVFLEAFADGAQLYECIRKPGQASSWQWSFRAPDAELVDRTGHVIGKHTAGPTWKSIDGSSVLGEVKARDAGPDSSAIPWLLLNAKSTAGIGVFTGTKSIQRVQTTGGNAPSEPCDASHANRLVGVPYTATYLFYRASL
jgi:uncharacterized protein DUF3455